MWPQGTYIYDTAGRRCTATGLAVGACSRCRTQAADALVPITFSCIIFHRITYIECSQAVVESEGFAMKKLRPGVIIATPGYV